MTTDSQVRSGLRAAEQLPPELLQLVEQLAGECERQGQRVDRRALASYLSYVLAEYQAQLPRYQAVGMGLRFLRRALLGF